MPVSFGAPLFLWGLLALPLVALLHFVRSRRRRTRVSALFLWQRARRAAERRRRIAPTWLLLAQLLFTALAVLALARPQLSAAVAPDRILVIDASASMTARDSDGVRLDKARTLAERLLGRSGRVALVRAGLDARLLVPLSTDRAAVRRALNGLQAGDRSADLARAVSVAEAIAPGARVDVVTDQPPPSGTGAHYHDVAGDGVNVGISAFELGIQQAYVGVVSNSRRPQQVSVTLTRDGAPAANGTVLVPAGGVGSITFPLTEVSGVYRASVTPPGAPGDPATDAMTLDDSAYAGARQLTAVVQNPDQAVLKAFAAVPGVTVRLNPRAAEIPADIRVLTGAPDPGTLPPGAYLLFAPASAKPDYQVIAGFDRAAPLLRFVDLQDVVVGLDPERAAWQPGGGWQVLATTGDLEPVLRYRDAGGVRVLQAAFNPAQTDLVLRAAFPALVANLVRTVRGDDRVTLGAALAPGTVAVPGGAAAAGGASAPPASGSSNPGGGTSAGGKVAGAGTEVAFALQPGVYRSPDGRLLLASLDSETESRLPGPVAAGAAGTASSGEAAGGAPAGAASGAGRERGAGSGATALTTPLAGVLLALAIAALVAEWLLFAGDGGLRRPTLRWPGRRRPGRRG